MRFFAFFTGAVACTLLLGACRDGEAQFSSYGGAGDGAGDPGGDSGSAAGAGDSGNGAAGAGDSGNGAAGGGSDGGSSNGGSSNGGSSNGGSSNGGSPNGGAGGSTGGSDQGGGTSTGSGQGAGPSYHVYASTDTKLYALDPTSPDLTLMEAGEFTCIDPVNGPHTSMVDIAVDRFQNIWGTTGYSVMPILVGGGKAHCGPQTPLSNAEPGQPVPTFYALTFAPLGVLDPMREVLVAGNTAGELWSIDADGHVEKHGRFGVVPEDDGHGHSYDPEHVGKQWELSGDIVFLANNGDPVGFATVRDCPSPPSPSGCSQTDTLIEIDMAKLKLAGDGDVTRAVRGKILKKQGCPPGAVDGGMYGIAAWNSAVFGFSRTGRVVSIDSVDAGSCLVKAYLDDKFSGAAVTTVAPIIAPPLQ